MVRTTVAVATAEVSSALFNMIQAIMQTSSLRYLSRNNAVNTFPEDMRSMFRNSEIRNKCLFKKEVKMCDGNFIEPDVYIDLPTPTLVFGVHNTERSKEVFINMLLIRESKLDCRTMVIIDESANIPQKDRDRLINMADHPVIGKNNVINAIKGSSPHDPSFKLFPEGPMGKGLRVFPRHRKRG